MKILEIVAGYPDLNGGKASSFIHTRNLYYIQHGITPIVLNFRTDTDYVIDGVQVICLKTFREKYAKGGYFTALASHASNVREHYRFLQQYETLFPHIVFFFHGHEVLRINECYPKPYDYMRKRSVQGTWVQNVYDSFKLHIWRKYYPKIAYKADFVFVSEWIRERFFHYLRLKPEDILHHDHIINNSIGKVFEKESYNQTVEQKYDFIIIRGNLDGSKYGVDIATELARNNSQYRFLLIGKGQFYQHYARPDNLEWINNVMSHDEIVQYMNQAKCALMPTRQDTQGLMTCEMATYGIPTITSDIPVCHEICDAFDNVKLIDNSNTALDLTPLLDELQKGVPYPKNPQYFAENTIGKEIALFEELAGRS